VDTQAQRGGPRHTHIWQGRNGWNHELGGEGLRRAWSQAAVTAVAVLFFRSPGRASPAANPPAMPSLAPRGSGSDRTQPACGPHAGASRHLPPPPPPPPPPALLGHVRFPVLQPHPRAFPVRFHRSFSTAFKAIALLGRAGLPHLSRQPPVVSGMRDTTMSNPRRDTSHS